MNKEIALSLRSEGWSCEKIAKHLGVPGSTVWNWVKNIKLTEEQKNALRSNCLEMLKLGRVKSQERQVLGEEAWKERKKEISRKSALKNYHNKGKEWWRRKRLSMKKQLVLQRGGKCEKCGYDKCLTALEFHHRDKDAKEFQLSSTYLSQKNINDVLVEIEKCDLLCSICHRENHADYLAMNWKDTSF